MKTLHAFFAAAALAAVFVLTGPASAQTCPPDQPDCRLEPLQSTQVNPAPMPLDQVAAGVWSQPNRGAPDEIVPPPHLPRIDPARPSNDRWNAPGQDSWERARASSLEAVADRTAVSGLTQAELIERTTARETVFVIMAQPGGGAAELFRFLGFSRSGMTAQLLDAHEQELELPLDAFLDRWTAAGRTAVLPAAAGPDPVSAPQDAGVVPLESQNPAGEESLTWAVILAGLMSLLVASVPLAPTVDEEPAPATATPGQSAPAAAPPASASGGVSTVAAAPSAEPIWGIVGYEEVQQAVYLTVTVQEGWDSYVVEVPNYVEVTYIEGYELVPVFDNGVLADLVEVPIYATRIEQDGWTIEVVEEPRWVTYEEFSHWVTVLEPVYGWILPPEATESAAAKVEAAPIVDPLTEEKGDDKDLEEKVPVDAETSVVATTEATLLPPPGVPEALWVLLDPSDQALILEQAQAAQATLEASLSTLTTELEWIETGEPPPELDEEIWAYLPTSDQEAIRTAAEAGLSEALAAAETLLGLGSNSTFGALTDEELRALQVLLLETPELEAAIDLSVWQAVADAAHMELEALITQVTGIASQVVDGVFDAMQQLGEGAAAALNELVNLAQQDGSIEDWLGVTLSGDWSAASDQLASVVEGVLTVAYAFASFVAESAAQQGELLALAALEPLDLFQQVFGELSFEIGATDGYYAVTTQLWVDGVAVGSQITLHPDANNAFADLIVHELGHAFNTSVEAADPAQDPYSLLAQVTIVDDLGRHVVGFRPEANYWTFNRAEEGLGFSSGDACPLNHPDCQWHSVDMDEEGNTPNEAFADLFMNWVYDSFDDSEEAYGAGIALLDWITSQMASWLELAAQAEDGAEAP